jgi:hypothetical protein
MGNFTVEFGELAIIRYLETWEPIINYTSTENKNPFMLKHEGVLLRAARFLLAELMPE